jgi:hypothetical protein
MTITWWSLAKGIGKIMKQSWQPKVQTQEQSWCLCFSLAALFRFVQTSGKRQLDQRSARERRHRQEGAPAWPQKSEYVKVFDPKQSVRMRKRGSLAHPCLYMAWFTENIRLPYYMQYTCGARCPTLQTKMHRWTKTVTFLPHCTPNLAPRTFSRLSQVCMERYGAAASKRLAWATRGSLRVDPSAL